MLKRPLNFGTYTWSDTATLGTTLYCVKPWAALEDKLAQYLHRFRFCRFDVKMTIMLNTTMMHSGKLVAWWLPYTNMKSTPVPSLPIRSLFALDTNIIDATRPEKLEIVIPYMSPFKWSVMHDIAVTAPPQPIFAITVLNPLQNAQATVTSASFTVYCELTNVDLAGPIQTGGGPNITYQSDMSSFSDSTEKRDAIDSSPTYVSVRQSASIGQSHEQDTTIKLSMDASHEMDYSKSMVQALMKDEHNLRNVAKRPSLLTINSITSASAPGSTIFTHVCAPDYASIVNPTGKVITNAQIVSRMATYWHGSMKYKFQFTMSKVSTVRVALSIVYNGTIALTSTDHVPSYIWDITGSEEKSITVPFLSPWPYVPVSTDNFSSPAYLEYGCPEIKMIIVNPLTSGSDASVTPTCYINTFVSVDDDMRFYLPTGFNNALTSVSTPVFYEDNLGAAFSEKFPVPSQSADPVNLPNYNFGEELLDIKDILCRYTFTESISTKFGTLSRAIPTVYKNLFRFTRFGCRYKFFPKNYCSTVTYQRLGTPGPGASPPADLVPSPVLPVLQFELPYYEGWYFDTPFSTPTSTVAYNLMLSTDLPSYDVYRSVSSDSVFSFWTFAIQFPT